MLKVLPKSKPFLSLYTQISPRLETFFIREWIEHNLMIGVDKIYLYNNGSTKRWSKKPYADYHLEYSDQEIMDFLIEIVNDYKDVSLVNWRLGKECHENRPVCQILGYRNCIEKNSSTYWMHIDPDEFIVSEKYLTIKDFIKDKPSSLVKFVMGQKIFGVRRFGKQVRGNTRCEDRIYNGLGRTKSIVLGSRVLFCHDKPRPTDKIVQTVLYHNKGGVLDMHNPLTRGLCLNCKSEELRYNHYRGSTPCGPAKEINRFSHMDIEQFEEHSKLFLLQKDSSIIQFLNRHGIDIDPYF